MTNVKSYRADCTCMTLAETSIYDLSRAIIRDHIYYIDDVIYLSFFEQTIFFNFNRFLP